MKEIYADEFKRDEGEKNNSAIKWINILKAKPFMLGNAS